MNCIEILVVFGIIALTSPCFAQEIATSDPALICGKVDGMSYSRQHRKLLLEDERRADFARWNACAPGLDIDLQKQVIEREQALFANWKDW